MQLSLGLKSDSPDLFCQMYMRQATEKGSCNASHLDTTFIHLMSHMGMTLLCMLLHPTVFMSNFRLLPLCRSHLLCDSLLRWLDSLQLISSPLILLHLYPSLCPFLSASCNLSSLVSYDPVSPSSVCGSLPPPKNSLS